MPREHDDDLEVSTSAVAPKDWAEIVLALTAGLERIATVLERGLAELREGRRRDGRVRKTRARHTGTKAPRSRAR